MAMTRDLSAVRGLEVLVIRTMVEDVRLRVDWSPRRLSPPDLRRLELQLVQERVFWTNWIALVAATFEMALCGTSSSFASV